MRAVDGDVGHVRLAAPDLLDPGDAALRRAFLDWVRQTAARAAPAGEELPPVETLEACPATDAARR